MASYLVDSLVRQARVARAIGYAGIACGALSAGMPLFTPISHGANIGLSVALALAAMVAGTVGIVMSPRARVPRPVQPALALLSGLALIVWYITATIMLARMGHPH